jgi:energy-coupling factor transporter transmembrane protein EcfT
MSQSEGLVPQTQTHSKEWVRSFLFSVKVDSPLARLHVVSKLFAILALSFVVVRFIDTENPDPAGAILMILLAFLGLSLSGVLRWVFRSYLLVMFPALAGMALTWIVFNADPGRGVLLRIPIYSGHITLGLSLGFITFLVFAVGWYVFRKGIFWGIVGGLVLAAVLTRLIGNPSVTFARFELLQPFTVIVSWKNLTVAITKALGYGAMIFVSLMLVMTTRDIELTGTMMQMRVNYVASFFVATMLRSLNMALNDYSTIRQAQIARGISLKKRNFFRIIADLAYMAVPLTATMLRRSSEVGDAALIRGFSMQSRNPTEFHEVRPFTVMDWAVIALCAALVVAVVVFRVNITTLLGVTL